VITRPAEPADVAIVGAGAAGGVAALRLTQAGYRVVCLEQGGWPDRQSYPGRGADAELLAGGAWSGEPGVRRSASDYPVDLSDCDMSILNFNGVGGGTILYAAVWPRLVPEDFQSRSARGVAEDWPLDYAELQPFYERIDRAFGVSGLGGNPAYPPGEDPPLPPLPIGAAGLRVARAHAHLGWHWWPDTNAISSRAFGSRKPCVQRGACGTGCNEGAKGSTDVTHFRAAVAAGCTVLTGARVIRVLIDALGRASGVEFADAEGHVRVQPADVVLLAANGIGTARLLLASASQRYPEGLANSSGLVGRRLMLHPLANITGVFADDLGSWRGHDGASIQSMEFYASDGERGFVGHAKWSLHPAGGPLRAALTRPVWGAGHHDHVRERLGRGCSWAIVCEDLPDPERRVTLSATAADAAGLPAPALHYHIDDNTRRMSDWHLARAAESLLAAGAHRVEPAAIARNGHLLGTARMGDDPATSVVDRYGISHDVPNLAVIDGSVFVTSGGVNPTATIAALALRAVEHLIQQRADVPVPDRAAPVLTSWSPPKASSPPSTPTALTVGERATLADLASGLIADEAGMPPARPVCSAHVDAVLAARPDLLEPLRRAITAMAGSTAHPAEALIGLRAADRAAHQALVTTIAAAYYRDGKVRSALGTPLEKQAAPIPTGDYPAYLSEGLLDHLVSLRLLTAPPRSLTATEQPRPARSSA
jgi:choline dehydrogenase-like flavoprotein